ncbi:single-stranded DNA-binding protein [Pseudoneobacillus sp. C159]
MINQVTLVGRLTKDPDLRKTPDGTPVTNITLAITRPFKNQNSEYEADFVQCTLWKKTAENTAYYCRKGSIVGVTGKIHTRNYENQEGKRVYITEVLAESVQFLSRRTPNENQPPARQETQQQVAKVTNQQYQQPQQPQEQNSSRIENSKPMEPMTEPVRIPMPIEEGANVTTSGRMF